MPGHQLSQEELQSEGSPVKRHGNSLHEDSHENSEGSNAKKRQRKQGEKNTSSSQSEQHEGEAGQGLDNMPESSDNPARLEEDDGKQPQLSEEMIAEIQKIQDEMEKFTTKVTQLLESGQQYFAQASSQFEEHIVELHQQQMQNLVPNTQVARRDPQLAKP